MKKNQQGFTLLELLVVIIMLALVATIAMVALQDARNKGRDTGIKANLANVRQHAESKHLETGNYNTVCGVNGATQSAIIAQMVAAAEAESPGGVGSVICGAPVGGDANEWAMSVALATDGYWCVDASGFSGWTEDGLAHTNDTTCQ